MRQRVAPHGWGHPAGRVDTPASTCTPPWRALGMDAQPADFASAAAAAQNKPLLLRDGTLLCPSSVEGRRVGEGQQPGEGALGGRE